MYIPDTVGVLCPGWLKYGSDLLENFLDWDGQEDVDVQVDGCYHELPTAHRGSGYGY